MKSPALFCPVCKDRVILGESEYRLRAFDRPKFMNFYIHRKCLGEFDNDEKLNEFLLEILESTDE